MFIIISHILFISYLRLIKKENEDENQDIDINRIGTL